MVKSYVRAIVEKAIVPEKALQHGLSLLKWKDCLVLYNGWEATNRARASKGGIPPASVIPIIGFLQWYDRPGSPAVREIKASFAVHGCGPLLYDIAMSDCEWMMADRFSVSAAAERVWVYYHSKRSDVEHAPLPEKYQKDPEELTERERTVLNSMYRIKDKIDSHELETAHRDHCEEIARIAGESGIRKFERQIVLAGEQKFSDAFT